MADFVQTMKEMRRMCAYFRPTCNGCPLCLEKGTNEFCGEQPSDIRSDPALVEASVMRWAAEHPEPVYPTWMEWLTDVGAIPKVISWDEPLVEAVYDALQKHIPADIAQKLGIEPKEET